MKDIILYLHVQWFTCTYVPAGYFSFVFLTQFPCTGFCSFIFFLFFSLLQLITLSSHLSLSLSLLSLSLSSLSPLSLSLSLSLLIPSLHSSSLSGYASRQLVQGMDILIINESTIGVGGGRREMRKRGSMYVRICYVCVYGRRGGDEGKQWKSEI